MAENYYLGLNSGTASTANFMTYDSNLQFSSPNGIVGYSLKVASGIHPHLYFKYIKKKFGFLEKMKLDNFLKNAEKAFDKAAKNGQWMLAEKIINELNVMTREAAIYAKGIKMFIEKEDVDKHKNHIRGGHISDTLLKNFTRVIPDNVLKKKEKVKDVFDDFVVYHYWDEKAEEKIEKKQKISPEEKSKMRDPVLFGIIRENNRLYFVAEWTDSHCDLSFAEMVDIIGKEESEITVKREPKFSESE